MSAGFSSLCGWLVSFYTVRFDYQRHGVRLISALCICAGLQIFAQTENTTFKMKDKKKHHMVNLVVMSRATSRCLSAEFVF